jgi:hypothetical protein
LRSAIISKKPKKKLLGQAHYNLAVFYEHEGRSADVLDELRAAMFVTEKTSQDVIG